VLWDHGFQEHDRKRSDQPWTARERINNWAMLGENPHHSDAGNTISFSYTPAAGSGTLTVSSGGRVVASIDMIGTYTSANFSITSGVSGTVAIVDPTVVNGGSAELGPAQAFPRHDLDLPDIAFGAQATIAYSENRTNAGGTLTVTDGRHARASRCSATTMAGSFVTTADGQAAHCSRKRRKRGSGRC
jgi:hypothetical protein